MKISLKNSALLCAVLSVSSISAKGLYEIVFINTTNQEFTYDVDLWADIEKGIGKKMFGGGDKEGDIKPLDKKTGKPSVTHTTTSFLLNKVVIKTGTGQKMTYTIPRKAGHDLSGKDWVFEIIKDGNQIKVCRKWSHTKLQDQMTIAAEVTAIIVGAVAIGAGIGAGVSAFTAEGAGTIAAGTEISEGVVTLTGTNALGQYGFVTTVGESTPIMTGEYAGGQIVEVTTGYTQFGSGGQNAYLIVKEGADSIILGSKLAAPILQAALGAQSVATASALATAATAGATIAAGLSVASAAVIGALEIASQETESAVTSAWKETKKAFSKAFGLSRKYHKAGCDYFKSKKAKKSKKK